MVSHILFDLDGTLVDSRKGIFRCIRQMLEDTGRDSVPDEKLMPLIGPPLTVGFASLLGTDETSVVEQAVDVYRKHYVAGGMFEGYVYDGIFPLLESLVAQRYSLSVATSKSQVFAEKIIAHFDLSRYFLHVYGPDMQGRRADKTELIRYILDETHADPVHVLMIGDREHDIIGAKANGVKAIGVLWGFGSRDELLRAGADLLLDAPDDAAGVNYF